MLRIISALIGIPLIMGIMYAGTPFHFLLFVLVITALASYEYFTIVGMGRLTGTGIGGILFSLLIPLLVFLYKPVGIMAVAAMVVMAFLTVRVIQGPHKRDTRRHGSAALTGVFYIGCLLSYFVLLREVEEGAGAVLFVLGVVWICDAAAYYAGRSLGKHPLALTVSPKKTIEGAVAGLLASGIGGVLLGFWIYHRLSVVDCFIAGVLVSGAGQIGDLAESLIKREYSVKDSGALIPGHGGVLDRIDSQLFAAPVFYLYLSLLH